MTATPLKQHDPRISAALRALQQAITTDYPGANYDVFHRDDPDGIRLRVTVDVDDTDEVLDAVIDQLYDYQVEQGLPVYVVVVQPAHRIAEQLRTRSARQTPHSLSPPIFG